MSYIFVDEAGNFDFTDKGTKYFILAAVTMSDWSHGLRLLELRHELVKNAHTLLPEGFHATRETQAVRNQVYNLIKNIDIAIDVVILNKNKIYQGIRKEDSLVFKVGWKMLFNYIAPKRMSSTEHNFIVTACLGTNKARTKFRETIERVVSANKLSTNSTVAFWSAASHPCLQIADYCAWAIQRWKERNDDRSYILIKNKIVSCFEPF